MAALLFSTAAAANQSGAVGFSGLQQATCNQCHSGGATPTVTLTGPTALQGDQTGTYTLTVSGGAGARAGVDIAVDDPGAQLKAVSANTSVVFGEVTHSSPVAFSGGSAKVTFTLVPPSTGGTLKLYAAGLSANGTGSTAGDRAGFTTLTVVVTGVAGAPVIKTAAAAFPATVTGLTTALSIEALDDGGEPSLTYRWAVVSGPGPVTFTDNGTNAGKRSTATFSKAGSYSLACTVKDSTQLNSTSTLALEVLSTPATLDVTPRAAGVPVNGSQLFTATAKDQFGNPAASQPPVSWSLPAGGGTISSGGMFKASASPGGPFPVTAIGSGLAGSASATIANGTAPTVVLTPNATASGLSAQLSVGATDDGGVTALTYTWSKSLGPGQVTFLPNGTNAAEHAMATFSVAGTYVLGLTVRDASGLTATASTSVTLVGGGGQGDPAGSLAPPSSVDSAQTLGGCAAVGGAPWVGLALLCLLRRSKPQPARHPRVVP